MNLLSELDRRAQAQCPDEWLAACAVGLTRSSSRPLSMGEARSLVARHADRWETQRTVGKAELAVRQFELAKHHPNTAQGASMLTWLGQQHLGQKAGGPDAEVARLLKQMQRLPPAEQKQLLGRALRVVEGGK